MDKYVDKTCSVCRYTWRTKTTRPECPACEARKHPADPDPSYDGYHSSRYADPDPMF
jgi:hypothetical protein